MFASRVRDSILGVFAFKQEIAVSSFEWARSRSRFQARSRPHVPECRGFFSGFLRTFGAISPILFPATGRETCSLTLPFAGRWQGSCLGQPFKSSRFQNDCTFGTVLLDSLDPGWIGPQNRLSKNPSKTSEKNWIKGMTTRRRRSRCAFALESLENRLFLTGSGLDSDGQDNSSDQVEVYVRPTDEISGDDGYHTVDGSPPNELALPPWGPMLPA